jgi:hypothetical protein
VGGGDLTTSDKEELAAHHLFAREGRHGRAWEADEGDQASIDRSSSTTTAITAGRRKGGGAGIPSTIHRLMMTNE